MLHNCVADDGVDSVSWLCRGSFDGGRLVFAATLSPVGVRHKASHSTTQHTGEA